MKHVMMRFENETKSYEVQLLRQKASSKREGEKSTDAKEMLF